MKLFDPLGNVWYDGTDIKDCSKELLNRLSDYLLDNISNIIKPGLDIKNNIGLYFKMPKTVIAVTGSAGKGSTSTIIADFLSYGKNTYSFH